jgi:hypothetical protein
MEVECKLLTWNEIYDLCVKISHDVVRSEFKPDAIVAVGRGGWIPHELSAIFST